MRLLYAMAMVMLVGLLGLSSMALLPVFADMMQVGSEGQGLLLAGAGVGALLGSFLVAGGAEAISRLAEGMGQELFNASILGIAVVMLAWHNIWMSIHGREMSQSARHVGNEIRSGAKALSVLTFDERFARSAVVELVPEM